MPILKSCCASPVFTPVLSFPPFCLVVWRSAQAIGFKNDNTNGEPPSHLVEGGPPNKKRMPAFTTTAKHSPGRVCMRIVLGSPVLALQGHVLRSLGLLLVQGILLSRAYLWLSSFFIFGLFCFVSLCILLSPSLASFPPPAHAGPVGVSDVIGNLFRIGAAQSSGAGRVQSASHIVVESVLL